MNKIDLNGRVAIVTGGAQGIGYACSERLLRSGARVVLWDIDAARLDQACQTLRAAGPVSGAVVELTDDGAVQAAAANVAQAQGRIDVLVNNAGVMPLSPLARLKVDEWDRTIDVNIKGVLYGIAAVLPRMQAQGSGHIVNVASIAGLKVFTPIGTVYSATKHAVRAISEGLRVESGRSIRVTTVSPGAVESELKFGSSDPEAAAGVQAFYEANQIPADSVARAIVYAVEQPADVDVNEIVIRPVAQEF